MCPYTVYFRVRTDAFIRIVALCCVIALRLSLMCLAMSAYRQPAEHKTQVRQNIDKWLGFKYVFTVHRLA